MKATEVNNFSDELKRIRDWTFKAEEDCRLVSEYKLPIVSLMRDLAVPTMCLCDFYPQTFLGDNFTGLQTPNLCFQAPVKDVVVLKRSDSLMENTHHQTPTAMKNEGRTTSLNKI